MALIRIKHESAARRLTWASHQRRQEEAMARILWAAATFVAMCAVTAAIVAAPAGTATPSAAATSAVSVQVYKNAG
jgi:hypothetical protein